MIHSGPHLTRRQEIVEMLKLQNMTLKELSDEFQADEEEIADDLKGIAIGVRPQFSLEQTKPICNSCGFVFLSRWDKNKVKPPTRCPKCKGEDIEPPRYFIKAHKENIPKELREIN